MDYHRQYKTDIRIARIFNTFGPRMSASDGRVVSNFIVQALRNKPITIYGNGNQTRSFCYVEDLIRGLTALYKKDGITGPVNLGNPTPITILQLATEVIEHTNSSSELVFLPLPSDDPLQREPDISVAREVLNWEPAIDRISGLKKTIEFFVNLQEVS